MVSLEFEWGSDIDEALNDIRSFVDLLYDNLPDGVSRDIRMKEAKRLAETHNDLRVSDLAYMVGFKDPKYFATCFKKEFGI